MSKILSVSLFLVVQSMEARARTRSHENVSEKGKGTLVSESLECSIVVLKANDAVNASLSIRVDFSARALVGLVM